MGLRGLVFGGMLVLCLIGFTEAGNEGKKCYHAKTCIHNSNEKCGETSEGQLRRFFDSCDITEYNCLHGTDYQKVSMLKCSSLPPIPQSDAFTNKLGLQSTPAVSVISPPETEDILSPGTKESSPSEVVETKDILPPQIAPKSPH